MRDFHESQEADRRDEFTNKLAKALGISSDKVKSALDGLHQRREDRFAGRLADALGVDADSVKAALDKLKDNGPVRFGDFAQKLADELNLDVSDVRAALIKVRPFHEERRGERHGHDAAPLRQLATALGVSRADLRAAFRELRQRRGERLEGAPEGAGRVPRGPLQPGREQGLGGAPGGRATTATNVTASPRRTGPSPSYLRRQPLRSPTSTGSSSRTRPTRTRRLATV